jgi:hypothetical protein
MIKTSEGYLYNNKYKKLDKLGSGAFGNVYKVELIDNEDDKENKKYFAMKKFYLDNVHIIFNDLFS